MPCITSRVLVCVYSHCRAASLSNHNLGSRCLTQRNHWSSLPDASSCTPVRFGPQSCSFRGDATFQNTICREGSAIFNEGDMTGDKLIFWLLTTYNERGIVQLEFGPFVQRPVECRSSGGFHACWRDGSLFSTPIACFFPP